MKKIIILVIFALSTVILSSCAFSCNRSILDLNYRFKKAKVYEDGIWNTYQIKKWDDYENDLICIWTIDGQIIYTNSVNIILYGEE